MDIFKHLETEILLLNNTPDSDFDDLSPSNVHYLIYDTYSENSPVHFQNVIDNDTLDKVHLFRIAEDLVKIIDREKFLKLTPTGALPRKVVLELYEKKYLTDDFIENGLYKLNREENCIFIVSTKIALDLAGITKKVHGKLTLTKKGTTYLQQENRQKFFESFMSAFADKYNWGYHDGYPAKPIGQFAWTFTIYLLGKYGNDFQLHCLYADKYFKAFPHFLADLEAEVVRHTLKRCYCLRSFDRFLEWFGIVEIQSDGDRFLSKNLKVKSTEILSKIFNIDI